MRVLHHHADTNGFFIALFEKVGTGPQLTGYTRNVFAKGESKSALGVLTRQMGLSGEIAAAPSRVSRGWTALDDGGYG